MALLIPNQKEGGRKICRSTIEESTGKKKNCFIRGRDWCSRPSRIFKWDKFKIPCADDRSVPKCPLHEKIFRFVFWILNFHLSRWAYVFPYVYERRLQRSHCVEKLIAIIFHFSLRHPPTHIFKSRRRTMTKANGRPTFAYFEEEKRKEAFFLFFF